MLVGLAWGLYSTIASIIISFILLGLWLNIGIAIGMAITIGLPAIFFVRQALLSRSFQADTKTPPLQMLILMSMNVSIIRLSV